MCASDICRHRFSALYMSAFGRGTPRPIVKMSVSDPKQTCLRSFKRSVGRAEGVYPKNKCREASASYRGFRFVSQGFSFVPLQQCYSRGRPKVVLGLVLTPMFRGSDGSVFPFLSPVLRTPARGFFFVWGEESDFRSGEASTH
jgi:hypothetical protein